MTQTRAPFGSWKSEITAGFVAGQSLRFGMVQAAHSSLFWSEMRPEENGRTAIVERTADGSVREVLPPPYSARSKVHEYGGGEFLACPQGLWFVNAEDQDVYGIVDDGKPQRLTELREMRFADFALDAPRERLIAVAERHDPGGQGEPENLLVAIALDGSTPDKVQTLASGADFYASARVSADGARMCWVEWDLPFMPWESSRLMLASFGEDGALSQIRHIAGGDGVSVFQPEWTRDGDIVFVCDETGWGNLWRFDGSSARSMFERSAEFGRPLWGLGMRSYAIREDGCIAAAAIEDGRFKLMEIDPSSGRTAEVETPFRQIEGLCACDDKIAGFVTSDTEPPKLVLVDFSAGDREQVHTVRRSAGADIEPRNISSGRLIEVPREEGGPVHALYYPPANGSFAGLEGTAPPAIVGAHGGPTGYADRGLKLKIQYWTSRGFAYLDVDYRGSYGYGRQYREALNGQWGVHDVQDVVDAALHICQEGLADREKLLISGGSAGGYTVLSALTFHDIFAGGASYYGIGDLQKLLDLTHKFESGYLYALTGTEPGETEKVFKARSPLFHAHLISKPVIFFQGLDDKVVPPGQSRDMVDSLKHRGVPVAYLEFEGEGHGFRRAETIVRALSSEYAFYARLLGLEPLEDLPPVDISNEEKLP